MTINSHFSFLNTQATEKSRCPISNTTHIISLYAISTPSQGPIPQPHTLKKLLYILLSASLQTDHLHNYVADMTDMWNSYERLSETYTEDMDGSLVWKWTLREEDGYVWNELMWLRIQLKAFINTVINVGVPQNADNFVTTIATTRLSRRPLLNRVMS